MNAWDSYVLPKRFRISSQLSVALFVNSKKVNTKDKEISKGDTIEHERDSIAEKFNHQEFNGDNKEQ